MNNNTKDMVIDKKDVFTVSVILVLSIVLLFSGRITGKYAASKVTEEWFLDCGNTAKIGSDLGREVVRLVSCNSFSLDRACRSLSNGKLNKGVTLVWDENCNNEQINTAINTCQNVVNSMCRKR